MSKHICFYHKADLDGHASGAIFKMRAELENWDYELVSYDYGDLIDMEKIKGNIVYFLDCTPSPLESMAKEVVEAAAEVIVCDHHKTALENPAFKNFSCGNSQLESAGCLLSWEYLKGYGKTPTFIELLSDYDCWKNENKESWDNKVLPFQYGLRTFKTDPIDPGTNIWNRLTASTYDATILPEQIIEMGKAIITYEKQRLEKVCKFLSFEAKFKGLNAICVNSDQGSSAVLDSVWDTSKHDVMVVFKMQPMGGKLRYRVSLYTTKTYAVDCGKLAKEFGGGGHPRAAGFSRDDLDFLEIKNEELLA